MKRFVMAASLLCASCALQRAEDIRLIVPTEFERTVNGVSTSLYTLRGGDLTMQVTDYGARITGLWAPDREGRMDDIVIGHATLDDYLTAPVSRVAGAAVGPVANRIGRGEYEIDGVKYALERNNNGNTLHSGPAGFDKVVWSVKEATASSVCFEYRSPDGEFGFPGNRTVEMTYTLTPDNELEIRYRATTDAPTLINMTNHTFFNLGGEGSGDVLGYTLKVGASRYTPVDGNTLPTGEIASVEGTPYDFRTAHAIGDRIADAGGYDNNFVIDSADGETLRTAAVVHDPVSGRTIEVLTDQPGIFGRYRRQIRPPTRKIPRHRARNAEIPRRNAPFRFPFDRRPSRRLLHPRLHLPLLGGVIISTRRGAKFTCVSKMQFCEPQNLYT